jgi:leucyl-tRNA synthetase
MKYEPEKFESKWQEAWYSSDIFTASDFGDKPKKYVLIEFPYPSGDGSHVGHNWNYSILDAYCRLYRMKGYDVLFPLGWDSFGLPTYNYAIKVGKPPYEVSKANTANFKKQAKMMGFSFDWSKEIDTCDPEYYKWTQWIFKQMYETWYDKEYVQVDGQKGKARPIVELEIPQTVREQGIKSVKEYQDKFRMAFKAEMPINWCPKCKTGLANEEVTAAGTHERCDTPVEPKLITQWMLRITAYADRLVDDLELVDYPDSTKASQKNWINRKTWIDIHYPLVDVEGNSIDGQDVIVSTTRPDTNFGATFVVLAPEGESAKSIMKYVSGDNKVECENYIKTTTSKTEEERMSNGRKKTGAFTGLYALNRLNGQRLPIYLADFVLAGVGTGAVVGVPAHDKRDFEFAQVFNLPVIRVVVTDSGEMGEITSIEQVQEEDGVMVNSEFLNGMGIHHATVAMMDHIEAQGWGKREIRYNMHDWVFSRQHYWGEPTPMVYCEKCGWSSISDSELPLKLPELEDYRMGEDGTSPLQRADDWKKAKCPECGGPAVRETDVMPNWAGSNWYFLRFIDPHNDNGIIDPKKFDRWMPVDLYYGGQEHVTLHLLYSRFVFKFLHDIGVVPTVEPYAQRRNHGLILGPDGRKMSKSWGNIISPDDIVKKFGADTLRCYLMFIGPYDGTCTWSDRAVVGVRRFIEKYYESISNSVSRVQESKSIREQENKVDRAIKKLYFDIERDLQALKFNICISNLMKFMNEYKDTNFTAEQIKNLIIVVSPFASHMAEELWSISGYKGFAAEQSWMKVDASEIVEDVIEIPVQINGKIRAKIVIDKDATESQVKEIAMTDEFVIKQIVGKEIAKFIYVPGRIITIVVK